MSRILETLIWEPNVEMQYELVLMLLLFLLPAAFAKRKKTVGICWGLAFAGFLFLHRALLAFLVSGLYLGFLAGVICFIWQPSLAAFTRPVRFLKKEVPDFLGFSGEGADGQPRRRLLFLAAVILPALLIQLCRINIAYDYDSLRYGLRSPYVLLGGKGLSGFFENPGLVNTVYTYSKGFELLTLPLSFSESYSYVLCVNVWFLVGILWLCGRMARLLTGISGSETLCGFFAALMPGITNMAVTAKADLSTLFFQLLFLYLVLRYLKAEGKAQKDCVGGGLGALLVTYALKPTAMLFSSAMGLGVLFYLLFLRKKAGKSRFPLGITARGLGVLGAAALFTAVCWLRTLLITGLPVTSVFSGIFSALGLRLRYPFSVQSVPQNGAELSFVDSLETFFSRLLRFLFCPAGEEMAHVWMAWGGFLFLLLLFLCCGLLGRLLGKLWEEARKNSILRREALREDQLTEDNLRCGRCLSLEFGIVGALSLVSLWFLYQIDGNYYMLLYALTAVLGTAALLILEVKLPGKDTVYLLLAGVMLYVTAFTGWAGAVGFTPFPEKAELSMLLPVDHREQAAQRCRQEGSYRLFEDLGTLEAGQANHVIAFMEEPECYDLPCVVESYTDIAGSGGNVYLVKKLNIFKEFLDWSGTDYICGDRIWLRKEGNERAAELLEDLIEDGTLRELVYSGPQPENAAQGDAPEGTNLSEGGRFFYGKIDRERVKEPWEVPLSPEKQTEAERELQNYVEE